MSKLNWEKQNKAEQPKEKRRRLDREKVTKAYANGAKNERERIIKVLESWECGNDRCYCTFYSEPDRHCETAVTLIEQIKGEQK